MAEELELELEEEVKEVKGFTTFDEALKDEDFSKSLMKYVDSAVSKGVNTFKEGSFKEAVEKGIQEKIEAEKHKTPEQLQLIEMQKNMQAMQNELAQERLAKVRSTNKNLVLKGLTEKGLPTGLSDFIIADTEENTLSNLESMSKVISDFQQGIKTEQLNSNNIKVPSHENTSTDGVKNPGANGSPEEWEAYFANNKK